MANVQTPFEQFNENIKLRRYHENATLAEKRERILRTLSKGIARLREAGEKIPSYRAFNQGSYDIGVGTQPLDGDYDIDVGIAFDLARGDHDPVDVNCGFSKLSRTTPSGSRCGPAASPSSTSPAESRCTTSILRCTPTRTRTAEGSISRVESWASPPKVASGRLPIPRALRISLTGGLPVTRRSSSAARSER